jgi:K+-sensing histidine kinase KdpD
MKLVTMRSIPSVYQYLLAALILGVTSIICIPISNSQGYHVVSFILLFVVSILSTFLGVGPVLLASTLGALIWNFFFIPPHHTFNIAKTEDILIFGLFFIVALVNGVLTTRLRKEERVAREREKRTNALFQLTRELSIASGIDQVLHVSAKQINNYFGFEPVFLVQDENNNLVIKNKYPNEPDISPQENSVANWVYDNSLKAGATTQQPFEIASTIFPLPGSKLKPGVVVVKEQNEVFLSQQALWDAFLTQVSNALEREILAEIAQKVRFLDESDRLFKTLFNSISHEFRIPVATIMGAADSMLNAANNPGIQLALAHEIFTASLRLNRLIENLLNMSRLESGHISVRLDWHDLNDLINKVLDDLKRN